MPYDMTYVWNLKRKNTNELIYKTETDSKTREPTYSCQGERWGKGYLGSLGPTHTHWYT